MNPVFNRTRKMLLVGYVISVMLSCLVVPWTGSIPMSGDLEWSDFPMGFSPIWDPPGASRVDLECLFIELAFLTSVTVLVFLLTGSKRADDRWEAGEKTGLPPGTNAGGVEGALPDSFWGHFTLFSRENQRAAERERLRLAPPLPAAEQVGPKAEVDLRRPQEQEAALKAQGQRARRRRKETEDTLFSLLVVSLTVFCIEIVWLLTNHVVRSGWGLAAFSLGFGTLFLLLAGYYALTVYVHYCEIEKRRWTPVAALNLLLGAANWYLPGAVSHFSVKPTLPDLIVWSACTLFFVCGAFVRLTGK